MKILIDIGHPAHVHFFKNPIWLLRKKAHDILVTSRDKEYALELLDGLGIDHQQISTQHSGSMWGMLSELWSRNRALSKVVSTYKPDVMAAIGGIFIAQVGRFKNVPSVVFYDTEDAKLQNALTYPFASKVVVPACYRGWTPKRKTIRYRGYHELSYLHPDYFTPDRNIALANGLAAKGDTFLIRLVSWKANHDMGERGWSTELLLALVGHLSKKGKVIISAEGPLPASLSALRFAGEPKHMHHLMAFCRMYVGESATMASEAVVLGVPAIYLAQTMRGYLEQQSERYRLVRLLRERKVETVKQEINNLLEACNSATVLRQRQKLLQDMENVPARVVKEITAV